jgi:S-(hydroxymethyl)glutathione dehydrogenase/alcohol dehydrogenase
MVPQRNGTETNQKSNIGDDFAKSWRDGSLWTKGSHLKAYQQEGGDSLAGFMGLGTWAQHIVVPETHLVKLESEPDHIDSGIGSVLATGMFVAQSAVDVEKGSNCAVFGSNSVAMILAYGLKKGFECDNVVVVAHPDLKDFVESFEGTFISSEQEPTEAQKELMATVADGYDYTFESCSFKQWGTVALEVCHKGFGRCCLLSAPQEQDEKISTRPFQLVTGRHWQSFL